MLSSQVNEDVRHQPKTASRNVAYKANKLGELMFARQSEMLMPEEELGSQSPVSYAENFEDLSL